MTVKTKRYELPKNLYIKIALKNILLEQWWVMLLLFSTIGFVFYFHSLWWLIMPTVLIILFIGFWILQFYGMTIMDQSKLLFQKLNYEISGKNILMIVSPKQYMPIEWSKIKKAKVKRNYILLILSKAHIIYLPNKVFNSESSVNFVKSILKRKKII